MYYVLLDSTGNALDSYAEEKDAMARLEQIVEDDPSAADDYAMLAYGPDGLPVGEAVQVTSPSTPLSLPGFARA